MSGDSCCLRLVCVLAHGTCAMEVQCRAHHQCRQHSEWKFFSTVAKHRKHCRTTPVTELWCSSMAKESDSGSFYSSAQNFSGSLIQRSLSPYKPVRYALSALHPHELPVPASMFFPVTTSPCTAVHKLMFLSVLWLFPRPEMLFPRCTRGSLLYPLQGWLTGGLF